MKDYTLLVGIAAGILTSISMLPQLVKIIKSKKADDISYGMLAILICGIACWIWYGFLKKDLPIIITNFVSLAVNLTIVGFSVKYKS